jgi:hypothetical protein
MSIFTDWLLAGEAEAEAVASIITTEEHAHDDWPNLCLQGIGEMELMDLANILLADRTTAASHLGDLLYQASEEGPFVAPVDPRFIAALADLTEASVATTATSWRRSEHLREYPPADLQRLLAEMVALSRRSLQSGTPILQLMTI